MISTQTLIEKYFSNHLTEVERLEFHERYQTDMNFKTEIDFLNNLKLVSESEDDQVFRNQLVTYETEIWPKKWEQKPKWLKPLLAIAAILILLLGITLLMNKRTPEEALYLAYFEPSKNVSYPVVRSESTEDVINPAIIAYSNADYAQALPLLEKAFEITNQSELLFYQGNTHLALNQPEEAIKIFNKHLSFSDALMHRTHWYLALAYLKSEQYNKAKEELKMVVDFEESFKKKEAHSLLKKLK